SRDPGLGGGDVPVRMLFTLALVIATATPLPGDDTPARKPVGPSGSRDSREMVNERSEAAIVGGLAWLAAQQQHDGSFGTVSTYRGNVGVAGICGMAFLAAGSTPGRGPYGETIDRCLDYVLTCAQPSGFLSENHAADRYHGPMYGHGFATLF